MRAASGYIDSDKLWKSARRLSILSQTVCGFERNSARFAHTPFSVSGIVSISHVLAAVPLSITVERPLILDVNASAETIHTLASPFRATGSAIAAHRRSGSQFAALHLRARISVM